MVATIAQFDRIPRILRLNVAGQPLEWVTWQDAVCLYTREIVIWTVGDPVMRIRGGHSRLDGSPSSVDVHSIVACDGRVVNKERAIPPLTNRALFGRDRNTCQEPKMVRAACEYRRR